MRNLLEELSCMVQRVDAHVPQHDVKRLTIGEDDQALL
jgi:hypothetical protein